MDTKTRKQEALALLELNELKNSNAARFNVLTALQSGLQVTPTAGEVPEFITIFYYDADGTAHQIPDYSTDFFACRALSIPDNTAWSMFKSPEYCECEIYRREDDKPIGVGRADTMEIAMLRAWWYIQPD